MIFLYQICKNLYKLQDNGKDEKTVQWYHFEYSAVMIAVRGRAVEIHHPVQTRFMALGVITFERPGAGSIQPRS